jgi:uncharacterized protein (TIGR03382 family)
MLPRALIALTLVLPATAAQAYVLKTTDAGEAVRWTEVPVHFAVSTAGARDLALEEARAAVRQAFGPWTQAGGTALTFAEDAPTTRAVGFEPGGDNQNVIAWSRDAWPFEPDALAMTVTAFQEKSGKLVDADILINEEDYVWGVGASAENDLVNALTHEVGHFVGLGHSEDPEATMFARAEPFETEKRTLSADDRAAVAALYPGGTVAVPAGSTQTTSASTVAPPAPGVLGTQATDSEPAAPRVKIRTGCAQTSGGGSTLWPFALLVGLLRRRRV